jgi:hypothetical protein
MSRRTDSVEHERNSAASRTEYRSRDESPGILDLDGNGIVLPIIERASDGKVDEERHRSTPNDCLSSEPPMKGGWDADGDAGDGFPAGWYFCIHSVVLFTTWCASGGSTKLTKLCKKCSVNGWKVWKRKWMRGAKKKGGMVQ